jgi:hypothetical protein
MKNIKFLLLIILFLICTDLPSATNKQIVLLIPEVINPYLPILRACIEVESRGNTFAYCKKENAYGILQIRDIKLRQYFIETGIRHKAIECFNPELSKKIFLYFAIKFNPYDYKRIAKEWNSSKTDYYWNKVRLQL